VVLQCARGTLNKKLTTAEGHELRWDYVFPTTVTLRGRGVDESDRGLGRYLLHASGGSGQGATTDGSGRCELLEVPARPVTVEVCKLGQWEPNLTVPNVRPTKNAVVLTVPRARIGQVRITGTLLDPEGVPVAKGSPWAEEAILGHLRLMPELDPQTGRFDI